MQKKTKKNEGECTGEVESKKKKIKKKFLAVDEERRSTLEPNTGFKRRTFELWVFLRPH